MFSQINFYARKSLNNQTPYDLVRRKYGQIFLDKIGIFRVKKKKGQSKTNTLIDLFLTFV